MTQASLHCGECEHLSEVTGIERGLRDPPPDYFCTHPAMQDLNNNAPGEWLGFMPVRAKWCPLFGDPNLFPKQRELWGKN